MISDDDICVATMLIMMIMQMMKMDSEDGDDDDNEDDDEDHDDGDATFAILCYSDRARLVACQSVSCPRAPGHDCQKSAMPSYSDRARLVACQSIRCPWAPGYDWQKSDMRCWRLQSASVFFLKLKATYGSRGTQPF